MILSKEQINRYHRHIIMPEISGQGQKKLLESTVFIYGETVKEQMSLVLYLSAMGIGNIFISFENEEGYESLFNDAIDLNKDVKISLIKNNDVEPDLRIILGSSSFIKNIIESEIKFVPTIISVNNHWKALFKTFKKSHDLYDFIELLKVDDGNNFTLPFIQSFIGVISSIEVVKLTLNLGNISNDFLIIDLFNMEFNYFDNNNAMQGIDCLVKTENINYNEINKKISEAKVLIVGVGGLGSPSSLALSLSGVGTIGLVDSDKVEASNLNRQVLHSESRIGMLKVESAKASLKKINPKLDVITYKEYLTKNNVNEIIADYDLVISAVDNIQTRYLVNDACYFMKKPVIEAGVLRFDGTNTTIIPDEGHCYRCLYPNLSTSCVSFGETGVLGAVPGVMGFIQAVEAFKVLTGIGTTLKNKILLFDGLEMEFNVIRLEKNPECPLCGKNASIKELQEYKMNCNIDD